MYQSGAVIILMITIMRIHLLIIQLVLKQEQGDLSVVEAGGTDLRPYAVVPEEDKNRIQAGKL